MIRMKRGPFEVEAVRGGGGTVYDIPAGDRTPPARDHTGPRTLGDSVLVGQARTTDQPRDVPPLSVDTKRTASDPLPALDDKPLNIALEWSPVDMASLVSLLAVLFHEMEKTRGTAPGEFFKNMQSQQQKTEDKKTTELQAADAGAIASFIQAGAQLASGAGSLASGISGAVKSAAAARKLREANALSGTGVAKAQQDVQRFQDGLDTAKSLENNPAVTPKDRAKATRIREQLEVKPEEANSKAAEHTRVKDQLANAGKSVDRLTQRAQQLSNDANFTSEVVRATFECGSGILRMTATPEERKQKEREAEARYIESTAALDRQAYSTREDVYTNMRQQLQKIIDIRNEIVSKQRSSLASVYSAI